MTYRIALSFASILFVLTGCGDDASSSPTNPDGGVPPIECEGPIGRWRLVPRTAPTCMNELRTLEVREATGGRLRLLSENFDLEATADATCGFEGVACSFFERPAYDEYVVRLTADALTVDYRIGSGGSDDRFDLGCEETVTFDLEPTGECNVSGEFALDSEFVSSTPLEGVCAELSAGSEVRIDAAASEVQWSLEADTVEVTGCAVHAEAATNWGSRFDNLAPRVLTLDLIVEGPVLRGTVDDEWRPEGEICRATGDFVATRRLTLASGGTSSDRYTLASGATCEERRPALCGDGICDAEREGCGFCPEDCGCDAGAICEENECVAPCDPLDATTCDEGQRCELVASERRCVDSTGSAGLGEACGGSPYCAGGLSCDATRGDGVCAPTCATSGGDCDTVCVAAEEGDAYGACRIACRAHETGTCPGGAICRRDLTDGDFCVAAPSGTLLPVGSACRFVSECEEGTSCTSFSGAPASCMKLCVTNADCPAATPTCRLDRCTA